ncbi:MAG: hypothetical protein QF464_09215, partial [Myxococcota bacterium]|nr:hypothetical protein [Myxococcota bacterium]
MAQTLHVAALAGLVGPGYARRDAQLRRSASVDPAELGETPAGLEAALATAARTDVCPWSHLDTSWFERRWAMGESDAVLAQSMALASELDTLELPGLVSPGTGVQASAAVGARPVATSAPPMVVAAPKTCSRAIAVAVVGERLRAEIPAGSLDLEDHRWMAEWVACTVIREVVGEAAFTEWVPGLMTHLVSEHRRAAAVEDQVRRIARAHLDQPPGEIERVAVGLGRR